MNRLLLTLAATAVVTPLASVNAGVIFSDDFSSSTLNAPSPLSPTAVATDYEVAATKNATGSSIAAGSLDLTIPATSAGLAEMQAKFASTPVVLTSGSSIMMTMVFQSTHVLDLNDGNTQTLNVGLFGSGGTSPVSGGALANSGLNDSGGAYQSGNAQNWGGYVGRVGNLNGGNGSQIYTRDPQSSSLDNQNQDLLLNNTGTGAYDSPGGTAISSSGPQINLTDGINYTLTYELAYDGSAVTVTEAIYEGVGTGGTQDYTLTGTDSSATYTSFDSLAFGGRLRNSSGQAIHLTLSSLEVSSTVPVPEPSTLALAGLGMFGLLGMYRRQRRQS